ncbi:hypothetical protein GCM10023094_16690 [Rhodococcus olei]|uniref:Non-specific serine/threonine protein kinase n=1 Tax=Rhodococcus olei TaxID=2161675 RepID=A0ABP8P022_9NOCA
MVEGDGFRTQRDVGSTLIAELAAAGFEDADEIGRGGFGVVHRCTQVGLDRIVAVKVFAAEPDPDNRARFVREQRAMGRLTGHPNIVGVLEVGETESGQPYLVMQYHPQGSLDRRIREHGPLPVAEALQLGSKIAGALDTAHRLGILHRDVTPANILFTDYGEPALADFGIAHIPGGFRTTTGTVTGSPAFTAPEILRGDPPTPASDVYGLAATLFCALTGHAAFERRRGERVVAQFLRITTQPVPDLRESGFPDDVGAVVGAAMSHDPARRPSAAALGDDLRRIGRGHDPAGEDTPVPSAAARSGAAADDPATAPTGAGNLPTELTSFVGRRTELAEVRTALSASRLVTLAGIGGVGKTRLALRTAASVRRGFPDGVWLVELGEVRDPALVTGLVATTLGVHDLSTRPLGDVLVDVLSTRTMLLVLDNCEQVIDAVAELAWQLLARCPTLHVLATSREPLGVRGETVTRVLPLTTPEPDRVPSLRGAARYDAVRLFAERAAAALPGFALTDDNTRVVARICARLDGLPLAIELAAARLAALSADQILQRLTDRFALLTRGARGAPTRQQTLRWCVGWSHDLCTPAEQQLWSRLSVFPGSIELDAAEGVCRGDDESVDLLDTVSALVDKSVLIREENGGSVRFRMLDTVRDYGREQIEHSGDLPDLRRRLRDWYLRLTLDADDAWVGPDQLDWSARLARELPNLRAALEVALSEADGTALRIAGALNKFWRSRGLLSEARRWLDRALAEPGHRPPVVRAKALHAACEFALSQGDLVAATALVEEARALDTDPADATTAAFVGAADGYLALCTGDLDRAQSLLQDVVDAAEAPDPLTLRVDALLLLGWAYQLRGDLDRALIHLEHARTIAQEHGESVYRSYALWAIGIAVWRRGDGERAAGLLEEALRLTRLADNPITASSCLQALAWISGERHDARRAAVLAGAADALVRLVDRTTVLLPDLLVHQQRFERRARRDLGSRAYDAAVREGGTLDLAAAIAFALGESSGGEHTDGGRVPTGSARAVLTRRERQVAGLVADGLTNRAIASRLVLSRRTVEGHVEHVLAKLGFTSRAQIAAWFVDEGRADTD